MLRTLWPIAILVQLSLACTAAGAAADASTLFAQGEAAFAAGELHEALTSFEAARAAGSAGPAVDYNIGVTQFRLGDYGAAAETFAALAARFPAMRELAEYNRGLALRATGRTREARVAFERARASADDKIVALAAAQIATLEPPPTPTRPAWQGYLAGVVGHDDNVALVDELAVAAGSSVSSPLVEAVGVVTHRFRAPLRIDASGYTVRYADAAEFDQDALRLSLAAERALGPWSLSAGPTIGYGTLDGDGFERSLGAELRLRRALDVEWTFETRVVYDDVSAGADRFAYIEGSRQQLRLALQRSASRLRVGYDFERNDRADPGVSPTRQRWSVAFNRPLTRVWTADGTLSHRVSRYDDADTPREEKLTTIAVAARRDLPIGWTLSVEYRWADNDSSVDAFSYASRRAAVGLGRAF